MYTSVKPHKVTIYKIDLLKEWMCICICGWSDWTTQNADANGWSIFLKANKHRREIVDIVKAY